MSNVTISKLSYQLLVDSTDLDKSLVASRKEINYAKRAMRQLKTPLEAYEAEIAKATTLLKFGTEGQGLYNRAVDQAKQKLKAAEQAEQARSEAGKQAADQMNRNLKREADAARKQTMAYKALNAAKMAVFGLAAGIAYAIVRSVKADFESIDKIGKASDRLGIKTEELTALQYAIDRTSGIGGEQSIKLLENMTRRTSEAAQGFGEAKAAIAELGLSAEDLDELAPDKMFRRYADAMKEVTSDSDKLRIATKLFDNEAAGVFTTLQNGSRYLDEMKNRAHELGLTFDRLDASRIETANDAMADLNLALSGFSREFALTIAPSLTDLIFTITDLIGEMRDENGDVVQRTPGLPGSSNSAWGVLIDHTNAGIQTLADQGAKLGRGEVLEAIYDNASGKLNTRFFENLDLIEGNRADRDHAFMKRAKERLVREKEREAAREAFKLDREKKRAAAALASEQQELAKEQEQFAAGVSRIFDWAGDAVNGFIESRQKAEAERTIEAVSVKHTQRFEPLEAIAAGSKVEFDLVNRSRITVEKTKLDLAKRTADANERTANYLEEWLGLGSLGLLTETDLG